MCSNNISLESKNTEETIVSINYWKEIHKELSGILKDLNGIILLTHDSMEFTDIVDLLNKTRPDHFLNVLYISLVRSYDFMKLVLDKKLLDQKRIFFIDCVSGFAFPPEDNVNDCIYHKPPSNLEEMKEIIKFGVEKSGADLIVIDSLTQFINFSRPTEREVTEFYKFLRSIRESALNINQDTFILLYDSRMGMMLNLPKMFTDLILKVEVLKEEPVWKD